jgi:hypothetical protein
MNTIGEITKFFFYLKKLGESEESRPFLVNMGHYPICILKWKSIAVFSCVHFTTIQYRYQTF